MLDRPSAQEDGEERTPEDTQCRAYVRPANEVGSFWRKRAIDVETGRTSHLKKDKLKNNASRQVHLVGRGSDLEARQRVELVEEAEEGA
jgi:hypothetical protein